MSAQYLDNSMSRISFGLLACGCKAVPRFPRGGLEFFARKFWVASLLFMSLGTLMSESLVHGQEVDADKAMRSLGSSSYYDKSQDGFASPSVRAAKDNSIRVEGWRIESQPEGSWLRFWDNLWDGVDSFGRWSGGTGLGGVSGDFFSAFVITLLAIVLLAVVGTLIYFSFRDYMPTRRSRSEKGRTSVRIDPMKAADLPIDVRRKISSDPLSEVKALIEAGRYRDAAVMLYAYELLALDNTRLIELEKGKTNRGYLKELVGRAGLQDILATTIEIFEDAYFGDLDIERSRFMKAWERLPEFHELLPAENSDSNKSMLAPRREALV